VIRVDVGNSVGTIKTRHEFSDCLFPRGFKFLASIQS
jgi:hypothetical protein